jgi:hypothetical protein
MSLANPHSLIRKMEKFQKPNGKPSLTSFKKEVEACKKPVIIRMLRHYFRAG